MSTLLTQVAEPLTQSIPKTFRERSPWFYDSCPLCGQPKKKVAQTCRPCMYPLVRKHVGARRVNRHEVIQPKNPRIKFIALTKGLNAIVDSVEYERACERNWIAQKNGRKFKVATTGIERVNGKQAWTPLANYILQIDRNIVVDHKNRNALDNRRRNLRIASDAENARNRSPRSNNTSGYVGVDWDIRANKWRAQISHNYKKIFIGYFDDLMEAVKARDEMAKKLHGEFAYLNLP